jgi:hypothetical protein
MEQPPVCPICVPLNKFHPLNIFQVGDVKDVCKKCTKEARSVIKEFENDSEFINYECQHPRLSSQRGRITLPWDAFQLADGSYSRDVKTKCPLCKDEMRKELQLRKGKNTKRAQIVEIAQESLMTKCCKVIATDPGQLLLAAVHNPPLPEHVWQTIYDHVPKVLTKEFGQILDESAQVNESEVMYRAIGEMFARYVKRRKGRF